MPERNRVLTALRRPMAPRDPAERHRTSTPLELLFDLCFVVAVAQAAAQLHHHFGADHIGSGLAGYVSVFFAIWWAWMNFTWFASAYDTDDAPYRLLTLLQIAGVLVLAAGVPSAFEHQDFTAVTVGYVIMRIAMVAQWLRAAGSDAIRRPVCRRYAAGVAAVQVGWVVRLLLPAGVRGVAFPVMVVAELAVPVWAERSGQHTTWHPSHITERYGLFTLIVLGECVAASTNAVQAAITAHGISASLLMTAGGGLLLVFGLWWLYFQRPAEDRLQMSNQSFVWGYGHYAIFAAAAALGSGLGVSAETARHAGELPARTAAFTVAAPVVIFVAVVALLQAMLSRDEALDRRSAAIAMALVLLAAGFADAITLAGAIVVMGVAVSGLVAADLLLARRAASPQLIEEPSVAVQEAAE